MSGKLQFLRALFASAGLLALALVPGRASADIFTFTDKDGVVHFTNRPPNDGRYKLAIKAPERGATSSRGASALIAVMPGDKSLERFTRYDAWIRQAATLYRIPEALVRAVIKCESDYDPAATSPVGARGLMQLMPETALRMQVKDIFDPRENIFGGTRLLRVLANTFNGNLELTVAAYNAGEGAVMRYSGVPPYEETQNYVTRVVSFYQRYRSTKDTRAASIEQ